MDFGNNLTIRFFYSLNYLMNIQEKSTLSIEFALSVFLNTKYLIFKSYKTQGVDKIRFFVYIELSEYYQFVILIAFCTLIN